MFSHLITSQYFFMFIMTLALTAIALEIFIPSFGLVGATGIYLLFNALLATKNIENVYTYISISIVISILLSFRIIKFMMSKGAASRFILNSKLDGPKYNSGQLEELEVTVGLEGIVEKPLRPAGLAKINDKFYDVMSYGEFIQKGSKIVIDRIEGNKIYCRRND